MIATQMDTTNPKPRVYLRGEMPTLIIVQPFLVSAWWDESGYEFVLAEIGGDVVYESCGGQYQRIADVLTDACDLIAENDTCAL